MIICMNFSNVQGQSIRYIKKQIELKRYAHIKDQQQFCFGAGIVKDGFNGNVGYGKYFTKNWLIRTDFIYENVKINETTLSGYYISPEANYCFDKVSNRLFLNAKVGLIIGDESLKNNIMVNHPINKLIYGEKIGLKVEYYISTDFSLNLDLEQRFLNNSIVGTISRNAYFSISYNF